ncbi:MAG: hypothetical protein R3C44_11000, partial [Chloroflexota bacterium]
TVTVAPGTTKTVTVKDVADLGDALAQRIVVIRDDTRWYDPAVTVNVVAGETAEATGTLVLQPEGNNYRNFGASQPAWRFDSSAIGFVFGDDTLRQVAPYPTVAEPDELLVPEAGGDLLAWSPISDTVLYAAADAIYLIAPGASGQGTPLVENAAGQQVLGLDWLPDGLGFIFTQTNEEADTANLFRYDLDSGETTPLTELTSGFLRHPGVSPDGQAVVFERAARIDSSAELWTLEIATGEMESLGVTGAYPDWRPQRQVNLFAYFYLPIIGNRIVGVIPSPTPTATPTQTPTATPTQTPVASPTSLPVTVTATPDGSVTPEATATATVTATAGPSSTPEPTATATTEPAVSPTASSTPANLPVIKNGDFESGANGDWTETINGVASPGSIVLRPQPIVTPRSGEYLAWLGGFHNQIHRLSQPVTLSDSGPLYLHFWYQVSSNETICTADSVRVMANETTLTTFGLCKEENSTGWEQVSINLSAYLGQTVTIQFEGTFDEATLSSFFVDDVGFTTTP